jgi:hypothetical protein
MLVPDKESHVSIQPQTVEYTVNLIWIAIFFRVLRQKIICKLTYTSTLVITHLLPQ